MDTHAGRGRPPVRGGDGWRRCGRRAARASFDDGDHRWVAELVNHVIQAEPDHRAARELLADTYEQLAYGSENGTWRSVYLAATHELRIGNFGTPTVTASPDIFAALTPDQLLDSLAIRVDAPSCWDDHLTLDLDLTDGDTYRVTLRNGVQVYTSVVQSTDADVSVTLSRAALLGLATGQVAADDLGAAGITVDGDAGALSRLTDVLQAPDPDFPILTPADSS